MVRRGSITIFLCLTLSTIMIVVMSLTEIVRVRAAYAHLDRKLESSIQSVMANYDRHLFMDYGILAFDESLEESGIYNSNLKNLLQQYLYDNQVSEFTDFGLFGEIKNNKKFIDLYQFNIDEVKVVNKYSLIDHNAEYFKSQILENMKYKIALVGLNKFTDLTSAVEKSKVTSEAINKKSEIDNVEQEISLQLIDLIQVMDGIEYKKGKPKIKDDNYCIRDSFIKKISVKPISMENQKINNNELFNTIKPHLINMEEQFNQLMGDYHYLTSLFDSRLVLNNEIAGIQQIIDTSSNLTKDAIKKYKENMDALKSEVEAIDDSVDDTNDLISNKLTAIIQLLYHYKLDVVEALNLIYQYNSTASNLNLLKEGLKLFLDENITELTDDIYQSLYPTYSSSDSKFGNLENIEKTLLMNLNLLEKMEITVLSSLSSENTNRRKLNSSYEVNLELEIVEEGKKIILSLTNDYLEFDYSGYSIDKIEQNDPRDRLTSIAAGKLEDYEDLLGEKYIDTYNLPSTLFEYMSPEIVDADFEDQHYTQDVFSEFIGNSEKVTNLAEKMLETTLINEYILGTFMSISDYSEEGNKTILCDIPFEERALDYEIEYIISGKTSDLDNKVSVAAKLLLIRFCFNFIHVIGDSEKKATALSIATALVGPGTAFGLNKIVQYLLLGAWALAESAYDVKKLFDGDKLPIIKKKEEWLTSISGMLNAAGEEGQEVLEEDAEDKKKSGDELFYVGYEDYLRLILVTSTTEQERLYRAMDLMQLNLQNQYGKDTHKMKYMLYEFEVEAVSNIKAIFLPKEFSLFNDQTNLQDLTVKKRRSY